jgi:hypothetical protein
MAELKKMPISSEQRYKNRLGQFAVPCVVSLRWLRFAQHYSETKDDRLVWVDVMKGEPGDPARKLCQLAISLDELEDVLKSIKPNASK